MNFSLPPLLLLLPDLSICIFFIKFLFSLTPQHKLLVQVSGTVLLPFMSISALKQSVLPLGHVF